MIRPSQTIEAFPSTLQCTGASNLQYNGQPAYLSFVQAISNTVAQTTSATLIQYAQYVCSCAGSNNQATSQVSANVQSVADAIATAMASAVSSVTGDVGSGCGPYEDFITFSKLPFQLCQNLLCRAKDIASTGTRFSASLPVSKA